MSEFVVRPGDTRPWNFRVEEADIKVDLSGFVEVRLRRYNPGRTTYRDDIVGVSSVVSLVNGILRLEPDNDYWPDVEIEGSFTFDVLAVDGAIPPLTHTFPHDNALRPALYYNNEV